MYDFMQDHGGISAVFKVPLEVRQKLYEGVAPPRKKMDVQPGFFIVVFEAEKEHEENKDLRYFEIDPHMFWLLCCFFLDLT